jgi:hypothetical protein
MKRALLLGLLVAVATAGCDKSDKSSTEGGVRGQVLMGPQCPGGQTGSPCPPKPTVGVVTALKSVGHAVGSARTDWSGHFVLRLPPGAYQMWARELGDNPRIATPKMVTVEAGSFVDITLIINTGIR